MMRSNLTLSREDINDAIFSGTLGTTLMTAFSYSVANKKGRYFEEPKILTELIAKKNALENVPGFALHYATGILFATAYQMFWKKRGHADLLKSGLSFGLVFGIIGVTVWEAVFKLHPHTPKVKLNRYIGHLLIAHLVYGEVVALATALSQRKRLALNKK